jgi:hypothetical protein
MLDALSIAGGALNRQRCGYQYTDYALRDTLAAMLLDCPCFRRFSSRHA